VNDGACALDPGQRRGGRAARPDAEGAHCRHGQRGVQPRVMGIGPAPASQALLQRTGLRIEQMDVSN